MVAAIISRATILVAGILYPAYSSFKAVRARSHREYTQWMMYWIVFAMFQAAEVLTDTFLSWLPFYFEAKIVLVLWLVLPITQGSKQLYRVVIHPFLVRHETEIDETLQNIGEKGKKVLGKVTKHGINLAATTVVTSAIKGQAVITETLLQTQRTQQQQQVDGGEAARPDSQDETQRQNRPSSSSTSSYYSEEYEEYEVIGEAEPVESFEDPQDTNSAQNAHHPTSGGDNYLRPDSNGLYHRT
jgi:receptor expression-enhancing protein 1/2/3/4